MRNAAVSPMLALRDALVMALALAAFALPAHAQAIDPTLWVTNGRTAAMARSGNTLYVGGTFTVVGPQTGGGKPVDTASAVVSSAAWVTLDLFDLRGRRTRQPIVRTHHAAGEHAVPLERDGLAAGVYFVRLSVAGAAATRRFVALP